MNILLISNYSIGCVPFYVKRALETMGHRVLAFSPDHGQDGWMRCATDVEVASLLHNIPERIDFLLTVEASTGTKLFPQGLAAVSVPTVWWGIDNHLNYRWHKEYANLFDVAFFAQKEYLTKAREYGTDNVQWLPLGCDGEIHRDRNLQRVFDVSFVGNLTPKRKIFFGKIGVPVHLVSGAYLDEMATVYSQSKIVLNISAREDLNMRTFEAMCAGSLLITQRIDAGILDLFSEGKHFVFHDITDAGKVVQYYLHHPEERETIARSGREAVMSSNTYVHRMETLLKSVNTLNNFKDTRKQKYSSPRICIQESLVYRHRSFRMYPEARRSFWEGFRRDRSLTLFYLLRFAFYRILERYEKLFKKNY